jgi:hypothetical protein
VSPCDAGITEAGKKPIESSYLESIHEDCRIFLEGIELFIKRDYPTFWTNLEQNRPLKREEIHMYLKDLKRFEGMLDTLYKEYSEFRERYNSQPEKGISPIEKQILQMLAFSYSRTGDFAMSQALMQKQEVLADDFTIVIGGIDGSPVKFYLTKRLKELSGIIGEKFTTMKLNLKYFFPSDIKTINAYLKISEFSQDTPFNQVYLEYYSNIFPGLEAEGNNLIHFGEIMYFLGRLRYGKEVLTKSGGEYIASYEFPMIRGKYELIIKYDNIAATAKGTVLDVEHLCLFKGFTRTDFRQLKIEEKQSIDQEDIISNGLSLERIRKDKTGWIGSGYEKKYRIYSGVSLQYGVYRLSQNDTVLGIVEIAPCYGGDECRKESQEKGVTLVKVFEHELIFNQDILDLVQVNHKRFGGSVSVTTDHQENKEEQPFEWIKQALWPSDSDTK